MKFFTYYNSCPVTIFCLILINSSESTVFFLLLISVGSLISDEIVGGLQMPMQHTNICTLTMQTQNFTTHVPHTNTHLQEPTEILGAEGDGLQVRAVGAPARLGSQADHALQCPLQAGKAIETRGVRHPQALKQTDCQLALEGAC